MTTANDLQAKRLTARGATVEGVQRDLARVVAAARSYPAAGKRLGYCGASINNFEAGRQMLSEGILTALYGEAGCTLRDELLVPGVAPPRTAVGDAIRAMAATVPPAAPVEPEDEDQSAGVNDEVVAQVVDDDDVAQLVDDDDIGQADAPGRPCEDVGDMIAREQVMGDVAFATTRDLVVSLELEKERCAGLARDHSPARAGAERPGQPPEPGQQSRPVAGEIVAEPDHGDMMRHAAAPKASVVSALDNMRVTIIEAAARAKIAHEAARAEHDAAIAAIEDKKATDLAALDRAAELVAEIGWYSPPIELCSGHGEHVYRYGKKSAGRLLDGVTHDGMPT